MESPPPRPFGRHYPSGEDGDVFRSLFGTAGFKTAVTGTAATEEEAAKFFF